MSPRHGLSSAVSAQQQVDVLIRGGTVVDGTGSPARVADVGITGDRITFVGDATAGRVTGRRRPIDAKGLIVAPGFIDPHTHTAGDLSSAQSKAGVPKRRTSPYLMQGVTTVITNNDGGSPIDIGKQLERLDEERHRHERRRLHRPGVGARRRGGSPTASAATPAQMDSMRAIVERAMDAGAIGMSTGLFYAPGSYATTEEVIELAKVAAAKGGVYDSHLRDESSYTIGLDRRGERGHSHRPRGEDSDSHLAHQSARHRRLGAERHDHRAHEEGARLGHQRHRESVSVHGVRHERGRVAAAALGGVRRQRLRSHRVSPIPATRAQDRDGNGGESSPSRRSELAAHDVDARLDHPRQTTRRDRRRDARRRRSRRRFRSFSTADRRSRRST